MASSHIANAGTCLCACGLCRIAMFSRNMFYILYEQHPSKGTMNLDLMKSLIMSPVLSLFSSTLVCASLIFSFEQQGDAFMHVKTHDPSFG